MKGMNKRPSPLGEGRGGEEKNCCRTRSSGKNVVTATWSKKYNRVTAKDECLSSSFDTDTNEDTKISTSKQMVYLALRRWVQKDRQAELKVCSRGEKAKVSGVLQGKGGPEKASEGCPLLMQSWVAPPGAQGTVMPTSQQENLSKAEKLK